MIPEIAMGCATAIILGSLWLTDRVVRRMPPEEVADPLLIQRAALMAEIGALRGAVTAGSTSDRDTHQKRIACLVAAVQEIDALRSAGTR